MSECQGYIDKWSAVDTKNYTEHQNKTVIMSDLLERSKDLKNVKVDIYEHGELLSVHGMFSEQISIMLLEYEHT